MTKELQREKTIIENAKVVLIRGVSKKTGKPYHMLRIETGNVALDYSLKPIFLNMLQVDTLTLMRE